MFVNSKSMSGIFDSLCYIFNISDEQFYKDLNNIGYDSNNDNFDDNIKKYVRRKIVNKPNEILIFHLSRRLNKTKENFEGVPLNILLTTDNDFSFFFKKHDITFKSNKRKVEIIYDGEKQLLNDFETNDLYLKKRLGYNEKEHDFCFNGFFINPLIGKNQYLISLKEGPEILQSLSELINNNDIIDDYVNKSTYYCYEYKMPIDMIIFDDNILKEDNVMYMLRKYVEILIYYYIYNNKNFDSDLIVRVDDKKTLDSNYYIGRFEIKNEDVSR